MCVAGMKLLFTFGDSDWRAVSTQMIGRRGRKPLTRFAISAKEVRCGRNRMNRCYQGWIDMSVKAEYMHVVHL